jgi:hypothetical protein
VGLVLDRKGGATVLADPGIHLSQATSAARPVASSRVNLLTKTEALDDASWFKSGGSTAVIGATAPDGTATAWTVTLTTGSATSQIFYSSVAALTGAGIQRVYARVLSGTHAITFGCYDGGGAGGASSTKTLTTTWQQISLATPAFSGTDRRAIWIYNHLADAGLVVEVWHPQLNLGSTALPYQRVGAASDYDASAGPTYTKLDGTDDGWLSATFTADTDFTDGMDALIAVRRDSTANAVVGLYESVAEANKVFGIAESGSGSGCVGSGAGTPTVLVDGTQLTGGTAVTRGTLHTALTPGAWHILEFRNLDLSTWTAVGFGLYTGYVLNGAYGGHKVFSNGQDANRNLARAQMAEYFGVTLP